PWLARPGWFPKPFWNHPVCAVSEWVLLLSGAATPPNLETRPETPVSGRKIRGYLKWVYDGAALASKPNRACCHKKYGGRIQDIHVSARKPFCGSVWPSVGVDRAWVTGSTVVFTADFCWR